MILLQWLRCTVAILVPERGLMMAPGVEKDRRHPALAELALDAVAALEGFSARHRSLGLVWEPGSAPTPERCLLNRFPFARIGW